MDTQVEKKLTTLRRTLDSLHYSQPLSLESVALVDRLLQDYSRTTQTLRGVNKQVSILKQKLQEAQKLQLPLKYQNERLVKQNNDLHKQMIRLKEQSATSKRQLQTKLSQLQHATVDTQFIAKQRGERICQLEQEVKQLKERMENLISKAPINKSATGFKSSGPANSQANIKGKKQGSLLIHGSPFVADQGLSHKEQDIHRFMNTNSISGKEKDAWANQLRNADQRSVETQRQRDSLKKQLSILRGEMQGLQDSIKLRDQEIDRLGRLNSGGIGDGKNLEVLKERYQNDEMSRKLKNLQSQNQYLNKENHRLNSQVNGKAVEDKAIGYDLQRRNNQLQDRVKNMESELSALKGESSEQYIHKKLVDLQTLNSQKAKLQKLTTQNKSLRQKLSTLASSLQQAQHIKSAYNSDKNMFSQTLSRMKQENSNKQNRIADLETNLRNKENEANEYQKQLQSVQINYQKTGKDNSMHKTAIEKIGKQFEETKNQAAMMRKRINQLQEENLRTKQEKDSYKFDLERTVKERGMLSNEAHDIKKQKLHKELEAQNINNQLHKIKIQLNQREQEVLLLRNEGKTLEQMLEAKKEEVFQANRKSTGYFNQLEATNSKNAQLKEEVKNLQIDLDSKNSEVLRIESEKMRYERQLKDLKRAKDQLNQYQFKQREDLSSNLRRDSELQKLRETLERRETELLQKQDRLIEADERIGNLQSEKQKLMSELHKLGMTSQQIEFDAKRQVSAESQNSLRQAKIIESLQAQKIELNSQIERKSRQLAENVVEMEGLQSQLRSQKILLQQSENEVSNLRDQLASLTQKAGNQELASADIQTKYSTAQFQIQAVQRKLQSVMHDNETLVAQNGKTAAILAEEKARSLKQAQQIDQLKSLLNGLDLAKSDMLNRLNSSIKEQKAAEGARSNLVSQMESLRAQNQGKNLQIQSLRASVQKMDTQLDSMQNEIDMKTQQLSSSKTRMMEQDATLRDLNSHVALASDHQTRSQLRIKQREDQILQLQNRVNRYTSQLQEVRQISQFKQKQVSQLQQEITTITRENTQVNQQLARTSQARDYFKQLYEENQGNERNLQQAARSMQLEKNDILSQYKAVCTQNECMRQNSRALGDENRDLYSRIQNLEHEKEAMSQQLLNNEGMQSHYINQVKTLETYSDRLTSEIEKMKEQAKSSQEIKRKMMQDTNHAKHLNQNMEKNREDLQRYIADIESDKLQLLDKVKEAAMNNDLMRSQKELDESRYKELQNILMQERRLQHAKDSKLKSMDWQLNQVRSDLQRKELRVTTLQNHLQQLQRRDDGQQNNRLIALIKEQDKRVESTEDQIKRNKSKNFELAEQNERLKNYLSTYEKKVKELQQQRSSYH